MIDFSKFTFEENDNLSENQKQIMRDIVEDYWPEKNNICTPVLLTKEAQEIFYSKTDFILNEKNEE